MTLAVVRDKGTAVHMGGQGACVWDQEQGGCSRDGPGASFPSWLPGPAGAGMEEERQSWLCWRQVLTSTLGPAQSCSKQKSSWRREAEGSLKMAHVVCRVTRLVLKAEHNLSRLMCVCDQKLSLHNDINCPFSNKRFPGMRDFLTESLLVGPLLPQVIPWGVSGKIWMM